MTGRARRGGSGADRPPLTPEALAGMIEAPIPVAELSHEEARLMLHELQVHQVELEMQNEELRRTQAELDLARARTFELYDLAPVGLCTLSREGVVKQANLTAAAMLGVTRGALLRQHLTRFILKESQDSYYLHLKRLFESGGARPCVLRMLKSDGTELSVQLESVAAQDADGKPVLRVALVDATNLKR